MAHIIVSGGCRGIGAATVTKFVKEGNNVSYLYSSDTFSSDRLMKDLSEYSDSLMPIMCDVSNPKSVNEAMKTAFSFFDAPDCLVSNAGISLTGLATDFNFDDYRKIMDINFGGFFNLANEVIPSMVSRKSGTIIAVSSMWGQTGASCEALYSASKGAIDSYVKALAKELGPSDIRVNAVSPGVIATDMLSEYSDDTLDELADETPLGRLGNAKDIADVIYYLSTPQASFITGQIIGVNGGFHI